MWPAHAVSATVASHHWLPISAEGGRCRGSLAQSIPEGENRRLANRLGLVRLVRAFARKCNDLLRLDIAIISAGIMNTAYRASPSTGHEEMFQINYLSTALLAVLLLPALSSKNTTDAPGRLTLVASGAALIAEFAERHESPLIPAFDNGDRGPPPWPRRDTTRPKDWC